MRRTPQASEPRFSLKFSLQTAVAVALALAPCSVQASNSGCRASPAAAAGLSSRSIPWSDLGAKATAQYSGEGLAVWVGDNGTVRLRCAFQRLEGEVTSEGLWLTSTVEGAAAGRFRVVADYVGRDGGAMVALPERGLIASERGVARFARRGLVEEYSVSADGVRQDFVVLEAPGGVGPLRVDLAIAGAHAQDAANGARLVLDRSGRKLAYSRLRVVDARNRELAARMEVVSNSRLAVLVDAATAAYPVRIDPTFSDENWVSLGGLPGANGDVKAIVADNSGSLYIGGGCRVVGDALANYVAKWDGSHWTTLGSGLNSSVLALAVSESDVYPGGTFTTAGGSAANHVAKWNGSAWSALGDGLDGDSPFVYALAVSGSDLYAGAPSPRQAATRPTASPSGTGAPGRPWVRG